MRTPASLFRGFDDGHDVREVLIEGDWIRQLAWSPDGAHVSAWVDGEVVVLDSETGRRVATGQVHPASPGEIVASFWSDTGRSLAMNVAQEDGGSHSLVLDLATLETSLVHVDDFVLSWMGTRAGETCYLGPRPEDPEERGLVLGGACPTCATQGEALMSYGADERVVAYAHNPVHPLGAVVLGSASGTGPVSLFQVRTGADSPRRLLYARADEIRGLRWSSDGEALSFLARHGTRWDAVLLGPNGRQLVRATGVLPVPPQIVFTQPGAPDGGPA